jgi:hypothetical protein
MRVLTLPLLLPLALAAAGRPAPARAEDPPTLHLVVGEETEDLGVMPRCDDLAVVAVTASGRGVRGIRPGATTCSFDRSGGGGIRRVYRIGVRAPPPERPADGAAPGRGGG